METRTSSYSVVWLCRGLTCESLPPTHHPFTSSTLFADMLCYSLLSWIMSKFDCRFPHFDARRCMHLHTDTTDVHAYTSFVHRCIHTHTMRDFSEASDDGHIGIGALDLLLDDRTYHASLSSMGLSSFSEMRRGRLRLP